MDAKTISGKLIKPDGTEEFWWRGVNYHNVLPEELLDAVLASEQEKEYGGKKRW